MGIEAEVGEGAAAVKKEGKGEAPGSAGGFPTRRLTKRLEDMSLDLRRARTCSNSAREAKRWATWEEVKEGSDLGAGKLRLVGFTRKIAG